MDDEANALVENNRQKRLAEYSSLDHHVHPIYRIHKQTNRSSRNKFRFWMLRAIGSVRALNTVRESAKNPSQKNWQIMCVELVLVSSTCRRSSATSKHWTHSPKVSGRIMFSSYFSSKCNEIAPGLKMNRRVSTKQVNSLVLSVYEEQQRKKKTLYIYIYMYIRYTRTHLIRDVRINLQQTLSVSEEYWRVLIAIVLIQKQSFLPFSRNRAILFFFFSLTFAVLPDTKLQAVPGRGKNDRVVVLHLLQLRHRVRLVCYHEVSFQDLFRL